MTLTNSGSTKKALTVGRVMTLLALHAIRTPP
jgi:hypothetical protein